VPFFRDFLSGQRPKRSQRLLAYKTVKNTDITKLYTNRANVQMASASGRFQKPSLGDGMIRPDTSPSKVIVSTMRPTTPVAKLNLSRLVSLLITHHQGCMTAEQRASPNCAQRGGPLGLDSFSAILDSSREPPLAHAMTVRQIHLVIAGRLKIRHYLLLVGHRAEESDANIVLPIPGTRKLTFIIGMRQVTGTTGCDLQTPRKRERLGGDALQRCNLREKNSRYHPDGW